MIGTIGFAYLLEISHILHIGYDLVGWWERISDLLHLGSDDTLRKDESKPWKIISDLRDSTIDRCGNIRKRWEYLRCPESESNCLSDEEYWIYFWKHLWAPSKLDIIKIYHRSRYPNWYTRTRESWIRDWKYRNIRLKPKRKERKLGYYRNFYKWKWLDFLKTIRRGKFSCECCRESGIIFCKKWKQIRVTPKRETVLINCIIAITRDGSDNILVSKKEYEHHEHRDRSNQKHRYTPKEMCTNMRSKKMKHN